MMEQYRVVVATTGACDSYFPSEQVPCSHIDDGIDPLERILMLRTLSVRDKSQGTCFAAGCEDLVPSPRRSA